MAKQQTKKTEPKFPKTKEKDKWEDRLKFQMRQPRFMMDALDTYCDENQVSRNKIFQDLLEGWLDEKGLMPDE